jgi:hypothetical protein
VKLLKRIALTLALGVVALAGLYFAMAEVGEVVVLHSHGPDGEHTTRLWVVDDGGFAWLRTGATNASWLPRIRANAAVELERGGESAPYRAVVIFDAATVARVNELSLAKYGWSERMLRWTSPDGAQQVAIRLDPLDAGAPAAAY